MKQPTSGKGDPYWYEWTVGLLKAIEMLNPDSSIESVSFQVTGHKGWDDVLVRYKTGNCEWIQVKHSREGRTITFGSFVGEQQDGKSLLGGLFDAWVTMPKARARQMCGLHQSRSRREAQPFSNRCSSASIAGFFPMDAKGIRPGGRLR